LADALGLSNDAFKDRYGFEKPDKQDHIVYYCRSGVRAENAAMMTTMSLFFRFVIFGFSKNSN
jgi:rhodanese-related sulfurtransferase